MNITDKSEEAARASEGPSPLPAHAAPDHLALDFQPCFALYSAARLVTRMYRPLLKALELTYPQYLVMLVLWELERTGRDGSITVQSLGERLMLDSGTLTPLLKRMESQGLLTRERSSRDERSVIIRATARGRALEAQASHIPQELARKLPFTMAQLAELRDTLRALTRALTQERP